MEENKFPHGIELKIELERWKKPGVRFLAASRFDWLSKGSRRGFIELAYKIAAEEACNFVAINGGVVDGKQLKRLIKRNIDALPSKERRSRAKEVEANTIYEVASEIAEIIPLIYRPKIGGRAKQYPYVRTYVLPSVVLENDLGLRVIYKLGELRSDFRIYNEGFDFTELKGIGAHARGKIGDMIVGWVNPSRRGLPSKYATTSPDKLIDAAESVCNELPDVWLAAGFGSSTYSPQSASGKRCSRITQPMLSSPVAIDPGEPALNLSQVGFHVIEIDPNGEAVLVRTWSLRDLLMQEVGSIVPDESVVTKLQKDIVAAFKKKNKKLTIGQIADAVKSNDELVLDAIKPLVTNKALQGTFPGFYYDTHAQRYFFHREWFQKHLIHPWPYSDDVCELRRLIFGCLHVGYNTTDYEYVRNSFVDLIVNLRINVLELVGDIIAGLKHGLMHTGQNIGSVNYSFQEIWAAELMGSVIFDVFVRRFEEYKKNDKKFSENLREFVEKSFVDFVYIIGNHDAWSKMDGHTPASLFHITLCSGLVDSLNMYLQKYGFSYVDIRDLVQKKILRLPEKCQTYQYQGLVIDIMHPSMPNSKTQSMRCEEALEKSTANCVSIANFHKAQFVEKWHRNHGEQVAAQAPCMLIGTLFEDSKMKKVDFGPLYVGIRAKNRRIFYVEKMFFNKPILTEPYETTTDAKALKEKLKIIPNPWLG